jgi:hypothetical protein
LLDPIGSPLVPLPKSRLIVACVASLVLAIPLVRARGRVDALTSRTDAVTI